MKGLRDLFKNITTLHAYRLNGGDAKAKAKNDYAIAKFSGTRGNDIKIVIQTNIDDETKMDVMTYIDTTLVDSQTIFTGADLVDNDYVVFFKDSVFSPIAGSPLTGGTNGTVDGTAHQTYMDKIESYSFNVLGVDTVDDSIKGVYVNFCKRMRDEMGVKFQVVLYNKAADYEGVINVKNKITDSEWKESSLVYWVTGVEAGCAINKSTINKVYDGEFNINVSYTQAQLVECIQKGEFTLHKVGTDIRVLEDINSLVTLTETKGEIFKDNLTIRIIDQIANDMAVLFNNQYLGKVPNDEAGRTSFRTDVIKHHRELQNIRAIENFNDADVIVEPGTNRKSIVVNDAITPIGTMTKLYSTTVIR